MHLLRSDTAAGFALPSTGQSDDTGDLLPGATDSGKQTSAGASTTRQHLKHTAVLTCHFRNKHVAHGRPHVNQMLRQQGGGR